MAKAVLVECPIRRESGSTSQMPPTTHSPEGKFYHFKPSPSDPRHVAWVEDPAHLRRFLEVGYELADDNPQAPARGIGKVGGAADGGVAAPPAPEVGEDPDGSNDAAPGPGDASPAVEVGPELTEEALAGIPLPELRKLHVQVVGKKPGPKHGRDLIINRILAQAAAR